MPGSDGKLTQAERDRFVAWLNSRQKNHQCEVCNSNDWQIGEHLLHGQVFTGGGLVIGGASYPQAFIVCGNCAHIRLFMAVPIGLGTIEISTRTPMAQNALAGMGSKPNG